VTRAGRRGSKHARGEPMAICRAARCWRFGGIRKLRAETQATMGAVLFVGPRLPCQRHRALNALGAGANRAHGGVFAIRHGHVRRSTRPSSSGFAKPLPCCTTFANSTHPARQRYLANPSPSVKEPTPPERPEARMSEASTYNGELVSVRFHNRLPRGGWRPRGLPCFLKPWRGSGRAAWAHADTRRS
jgi:hypothetical protein